MSRPSTQEPRPRALPRLAIACALLVSSGCLIPPRSVVVTASGVIRAPNSQLADSAAEYVEWARTELERRIPGLRDVRTDVWIQERAYAGALIWMKVGSLHAFTLETPSLENPRIHVPVETYRTSISHELVHALLGEDWSTLPAILEEGLCDSMSVQLADDPQLRLNLLVSATLGKSLSEAKGSERAELDIRRLLRARQSLELHEHGAEFAAHAYGLGYVLVDMIITEYGVEFLHELCLRAKREDHEFIPAEWILDAVRLSPDTDLNALLAEPIDEALFQHLLRSGELERLVEDLQSTESELPWAFDAILITYEAEMLEGGGIRRRLKDLPGFLAWARENHELLDSLHDH